MNHLKGILCGLALAVAFLLLTGVSSAKDAPLDLPALAKAARPAVMTIVTYDDKGKVSYSPSSRPKRGLNKIDSQDGCRNVRSP
jgi:hypothetical protein